MDKFVIIAAGGHGERMNAGTPKQFILLLDKPILMHTLSIFPLAIPSIHIILILPDDQIATWEELCIRHSFDIPHQVTNGGKERFHSVRNGLELVSDRCLVGIHDGVRPLVSRETIIKAYIEAEKYGTAIPAVPITESVRSIGDNVSRPLKRDTLRIIQTPQVFHSSLIKNAYKREYRSDFTDDATVYEAMGEKIHLINGNFENVKITSQNDLIIAEALLKNKQI